MWYAFTSLSGARLHNQGFSQPIQYSEMLAWMDLHQIEDYEERETMAYIIRLVDDEWLKLSHQKALAEAKSSTAKSRRR